MAQMAMSSTNLYHYTTQNGRDGILSDMFMRASSDFDGRTGGPVPARYGTGVYFTSYRPRNPRDNILPLIYDGGDMEALDKWKNLSFVITISKEVHYSFNTVYYLTTMSKYRVQYTLYSDKLCRL